MLYIAMACVTGKTRGADGELSSSLSSICMSCAGLWRVVARALSLSTGKSTVELRGTDFTEQDVKEEEEVDEELANVIF